jgi:antitoxin component YwqK of YwqJK toxin-antitoxin module
MINNNIKYYTFFILLLCWGCSNKNKSKTEYYANGKIKQIYSLKDNKKQGKEILYSANGNIKSISSYMDNLLEGEQLNFYENNGLLESKLSFKKGVPNGSAYWFYEGGALRACRYYVNGREDDIGFDYWDYRFIINKSLIRFNHDGKVYYKMNFDSSGKPTYSEGDSINSGVDRIK